MAAIGRFCFMVDYMLVGEIYGKPYLESAWIHGIVGQDKIV
jgi:hypothetical protein